MRAQFSLTPPPSSLGTCQVPQEYLTDLCHSLHSLVRVRPFSSYLTSSNGLLTLIPLSPFSVFLPPQPHLILAFSCPSPSGLPCCLQNPGLPLAQLSASVPAVLPTVPPVPPTSRSPELERPLTLASSVVSTGKWNCQPLGCRQHFWPHTWFRSKQMPPL